MKTLLCSLLILSLAWTASAATQNNDDSCDIGVAPAATLLLPYFEVDLDDPFGETTIFTITNVTNVDRIARVTLWTDYAFPVVTFNLYLTGYAVQSINLDDVIRRGVFASDEGTGTSGTRRGEWSHRNRAVDTSACGRLASRLSAADVERMQSAFRDGVLSDAGDLQGCSSIGHEHDNAIGYATIDVVRNCESNTPFSDEYWTEDLTWDNVLIGDYQQVDPSNGSATGAPLVHIRAIPEGGSSAERLARPRKYDAGFPRTFYSRYQTAATPRLDGRQPLPSVFAARWRRIGGWSSLETTTLKIWREGRPGRTVSCLSFSLWYANKTGANFAEAVVFDEAENAVAGFPSGLVGNLHPHVFELPPASRIAVSDSVFFPQLTNGAVGGWMYLNLDLGTLDTPLSSSNWVISSFRTVDGSFDIDAAALGNGCSAEVPDSEVSYGSHVIGPLPNVNP